MPHTAGVACRRSGREQLLALDQHDVGDAAARQVIRNARAHAAAADDDDVSGAFHAAVAYLRAAARSTCSITRRMLPPRIFSTSASEYPFFNSASVIFGSPAALSIPIGIVAPSKSEPRPAWSTPATFAT